MELSNEELHDSGIHSHGKCPQLLAKRQFNEETVTVTRTWHNSAWTEKAYEAIQRAHITIYLLFNPPCTEIFRKDAWQCFDAP